MNVSKSIALRQCLKRLCFPSCSRKCSFNELGFYLSSTILCDILEKCSDTLIVLNKMD